MIFTLSNKIFSRYYSYRIRLFRCGRFKHPHYKIVVVNWHNRIVEVIGYYDPHLNKLGRKTIALDRIACINWLEFKAIPSPFVFFIFEKTGLIKF